ncbi:hypothetical protein K2173_003363 [Erythroxylum novogranatense]|uniref:Uncharacterized protein n=1 Tax=Erythroxylum novogranatense TaxID=1862640 RepID=A0AAV8S8F4_9ROSI|nr:hypothetical protein K2173_003363 [Erythroxylum novogranatense]
MGQRLCVPDIDDLRREIVEEAHVAAYVKTEHQAPVGKLHSLLIPEWKWERITIDFVTGLPRTPRQHDAIWVIVDRLTKSAHFLLVRESNILDQLAQKYVAEIVRLHGVPLSIGPELIQDTVDKVQLIRSRIKAAQDRQKSYVDQHRREMEYSVGDRVFLRVSPWKGVLRFGRKGKLSPRYIGPYEILERIGPLAYRLALPSEMSQMHDVFHVSMLRRYRSDPTHVIPTQEIEIASDLSYVEEPVQIIGSRVKQLRNRVIPLVKVLWKNHSSEEATWEIEEHMSRYPHLFDRTVLNFEDEIFY